MIKNLKETEEIKSKYPIINSEECAGCIVKGACIVINKTGSYDPRAVGKRAACPALMGD